MSLNFQSNGVPICIIADKNDDKKRKPNNPIICVSETKTGMKSSFDSLSLENDNEFFQIIPNPDTERQI